jgi:hypothetical protein
MRVLVACEFSGTVRDAFAARGHDAWSCDLLPSESEGNHIEGNVLDILDAGWDLMIAHPPCTRLANSGVHWLNRRDLWSELDESAEFFRDLLHAPIPRVCVENPIPHKYAVKRIGRKYDQIVRPWQFGQGLSKAVCLWLRGLPKLEPTEIVEGREQYIMKMGPSEDRAKKRSVFFPGIAAAMAEQWGDL